MLITFLDISSYEKYTNTTLATVNTLVYFQIRMIKYCKKRLTDLLLKRYRLRLSCVLKRLLRKGQVVLIAQSLC